MRRRVLCLLATTIAVAFCWLKSYEVLPTQASWSGWTDTIPSHNWVGQTFTANFDSICWCDMFIGHVGDTSHHYSVEVRDYASNALLAYRNDVAAPGQGHVWLKFELLSVSGQKFGRGKEYLLKVTRPGDSINWYKDISNKYGHGRMVGGTGLGQPPPQSGDDLCARIYGRMNAVDSAAVWSAGSVRTSGLV